MPDEPVTPGEYTGSGEDPTAGHESVGTEGEQYPEGELADEGAGPDTPEEGG